MRRLAAALLPLGLAALAGCNPPAGAGAPAAAGFGLGALPAATLAGRAWALTPAGWVPAAGVAVRVDGRPEAVTTDATGAFQVAGLPAGAWRAAAEAPGQVALAAAGRLAAGEALAGLTLALVPAADQAAPLPAPDAALVAGVVLDDRGLPVPAATVHCVDGGSDDGAGGNRRWTADAHGLFVGALPAWKAGGGASLLAYGRTADGTPAEGRRIAAVMPTRGTAAAIALRAPRPGTED